MKDARAPFKRAMYARLNGRLTSITAQPVLVGNNVPDGSTMPYVQIGESTALNISCKGEPGQEVTLALHVYSDYNGDAEADLIADQIMRLVTGASLAVPGFSLSELSLDYAEVVPDPTGEARHGMVRWRAELHEVR